MTAIENGFDPILAMMRGEYVETGWLHFIATPDTKDLMHTVREKIQHILDTAHAANPAIYKKRNITFQVLEGYGQFANGESIASIDTSVRGKHVYYFSDPHGDSKHYNKDTKKFEERSLNDKLMHDILALWALKENWAKSVNLVLQNVPYARQDKSTPNKREAASLDRIWGWISDITGENGYVLCMDLHNPASKSSFKDTNFINLYSGWFVKRVVEMAREEDEWFTPVIAPADQGWYGKTSKIAEEYQFWNVISIKTRDYTTKNKVSNVNVIWDIEGKDIIVHDDILDTGGTLVTLLEKLLEKKPRSIRVAITHGLFNADAFAKLSSVIIKSNQVIKWVYVSDSVYKEIEAYEWIKRVSTSDILTNSILSIFQDFPVRRGNDTDYAAEEEKA